MMITRVTSGVTNVNRLFTKVNKNWKFKKFDYIRRNQTNYFICKITSIALKINYRIRSLFRSNQYP